MKYYTIIINHFHKCKVNVSDIIKYVKIIKPF